jgi:uncharacterized protein YuzE
MKLHYYPETDSLYIEFRPSAGTETREVASGLNVDLDDKCPSGNKLSHLNRLPTSP